MSFYEMLSNMKRFLFLCIQ